jgi:hypothetical protein
MKNLERIVYNNNLESCAHSINVKNPDRTVPFLIISGWLKSDENNNPHPTGKRTIFWGYMTF